MSGLKEIYDSMSSRMKSHVFGSIVISFILLNWQVIYVLCFSEMPIFFRFLYFKMNTSSASLYYWPVVVGLFFGLGAPWVNAGAHWVVSWPLSYIKSRDELSALRREGRLEDEKLKLEQKKSAVQDERAKTAKLIEENQNADKLLREMQRKIEVAKKQEDALQGRINFKAQKIEEMDARLVQADAKSSKVSETGLSDNSKISETKNTSRLGKLNFKEFLALFAIREVKTETAIDTGLFGDPTIHRSLQNLSKFDDDKRLLVELGEGAHGLKSLGLAHSYLRRGKELYELTSEGYSTFDQFENLNNEQQITFLRQLRGEA